MAPFGRIFFILFLLNQCFFVKMADIITKIACNCCGNSGEGGAATSAICLYPRAVTTDSSLNVFWAEDHSHKIRKLTYSTGIMTTILGGNGDSSSGDGGAATSAAVRGCYDVATDSSGTYII